MAPPDPPFDWNALDRLDSETSRALDAHRAVQRAISRWIRPVYGTFASVSSAGAALAYQRGDSTIGTGAIAAAVVLAVAGEGSRFVVRRWGDELDRLYEEQKALGEELRESPLPPPAD